MIGHSICNDDWAMVSNAINEWVEQGAQMIVCTGGMSVNSG